jgi:hypothetical protein
MRDIQSTRQELENLWRKRVEDAKIQLDFASKYVKEVQRDLKAGTIPSPDGHYAYQHGLRVETLALKHYRRVLNTLNELVLHGKIPDEQEPPRSSTMSASGDSPDDGSE